MRLRLVVVRDGRCAVDVVVDRTQHDVALRAVDLGRNHGADGTEVVDEDRLVLARAATGTGGEDHRVAAGDCMVDGVFEVGENRGYAKRVELRALIQGRGSSRRDRVDSPRVASIARALPCCRWRR